MECIDIIEKLRTDVDPKETPCVLVQGYYKPGDGGGGFFLWDEKVKNDDSGTVIKSDKSAIKGCWKRIFDDFVSVKWFGAKGDMKDFYFAPDDPTLPPPSPPPPLKIKHYKGTTSSPSLDRIIVTGGPPEISSDDNLGSSHEAI